MNRCQFMSFGRPCNLVASYQGSLSLRFYCKPHAMMQRTMSTEVIDPIPLFTAGDIKRGEQLRDEGIQRASDHAEREREEWNDAAYEYFVEYATTHDQFATEDVREHALRDGFEDAPDARAWGAVAARARREGLIIHSHFESARNAKKHRCPLRIWKTKGGE